MGSCSVLSRSSKLVPLQLPPFACRRFIRVSPLPPAHSFAWVLLLVFGLKAERVREGSLGIYCHPGDGLRPFQLSEVVCQRDCGIRTFAELFVPQSDHGIDAHRSSCGDAGRKQSRRYDDPWSDCENHQSMKPRV